MKCKHCNGTGKIRGYFYEKTGVNKWEKVWGDSPCDECNGTGKIEVTNEEWLCNLSTEEKAKVFANATYSTAETPLTILWGGKEAEQKKWELWLKQPHTEKE